MDLRAYYSKIARLKRPHGRSSGHGEPGNFRGRQGWCTHRGATFDCRPVDRGRSARVATPEEADAFYEQHRVAREKQAREEAARRLQVMVIQPPESDLENSPAQERRKQRDRS